VNNAPTLRAIDLCAGAGGWACAARGLPIRFVAVADWAEDCLETWSLNHGQAHPDCAVLCCDLASAEGRRQILKAVKAARGVDLILGAIPCEQLSHARANRPLKPGELEAVHDLIDSSFSLVKKLKPRYWSFEDVTQVEGHLVPPIEFGINYDVRRIQAADYGPQRRLRTFFGRFPSPAPPEPGPRILSEVLRPGPYRTLPQLAKYKRSKSKWYGGDKIRVQETESPGATVISSQGGMGSRAERSGMVPVVRVQDADQACPTVADFGSRHERAALVGTSQARVCDATEPAPAVTTNFRDDAREIINADPPFQWQRVQLADEAGFAVAAGHGDRGNASVEQQGLVRVMEWQEAAALQGFPLDYCFAASWSRTWKLVAQAIPIYVGRAILRAIVEDWSLSSSDNLT